MLRIAREPDPIESVRGEMLYYATLTTWWTTNREHIYRKPDDSRLPCDPRGSVLFQTNNVEGFLAAARGNPDHYGRHRLRAFMAARHGVIVAPSGLPTSVRTWDEVNRLLDEFDAASQESS